MPMPYLPASVMPDGLICEAMANGMSSCSGRSCRAASCRVNQSLFVGDALAAQQAADDADRLVLAVALGHRVDAERVGVGRQRARARAEDRAAAGHVVELHHALRDVERVVVGQRDHAGGELDALGALGRPRRGTSRARRSSPSRDEWCSPHQNSSKPSSSRCSTNLMSRRNCSSRVFADRMMGCEECAETEPRHAGPPWETSADSGPNMVNGCSGFRERRMSDVEQAAWPW